LCWSLLHKEKRGHGALEKDFDFQRKRPGEERRWLAEQSAIRIWERDSLREDHRGHHRGHFNHYLRKEDGQDDW